MSDFDNLPSGQPNHKKEIFKFLEPGLGAKFTLYYSKYFFDDKKVALSNSLRVALFHLDKGEERPFFASTVHVHFDENDPGNLERVNITCSKNFGIDFHFLGLDINGIHYDEFDRLLEFMKSMYGVKVKYTEDIFGFLSKNDKDVTVEIDKPFPVLSPLSRRCRP